MTEGSGCHSERSEESGEGVALPKAADFSPRYYASTFPDAAYAVPYLAQGSRQGLPLSRPTGCSGGLQASTWPTDAADFSPRPCTAAHDGVDAPADLTERCHSLPQRLGPFIQRISVSANASPVVVSLMSPTAAVNTGEFPAAFLDYYHLLSLVRTTRSMGRKGPKIATPFGGKVLDISGV